MHPLTKKMQMVFLLLFVLVANFPPLHVSTETRWALWFVLLGMAITSVFDHLIRKVSIGKRAHS